MNFLLAIPIELRLAGLFALGAAVGAFVNWGIYSLAWHRRSISPWGAPHEKAPPRRWFDRLPILGWIGLRREASLHPPLAWLRSLVIELFIGLAYAALYSWNLSGGLLPQVLPPPIVPDPLALHALYLLQIVLLPLMAVATFIDFDEKTIPDAITVPGTLIALVLAALLPAARLPIVSQTPRGAPRIDGLLLTSPLDWPPRIDGGEGLLYGCLCFVFWCFAIMPRVWVKRRRLGRKLRYFSASLTRRRSWRFYALAAAGCGAVAGVWYFTAGRPGAGEHWRSLLSALVGMAFAGGLIWGVRIIGSRALEMEAMGFGDVTLMFMIGAFLGWQPSLIIFFLAPFAALLIAVLQKLITREVYIAFGPYLCLATMLLLLGWAPFWERGRGAFLLGWLIPQIVGVGLILMGAMLIIWRYIKERLLYGDEEV